MIQLPRYAEPLFNPYRYKVLKGGRGSAKSYSVARLLLIKALNKNCKVLCSREFQNSIADSVHSLIVEQAEEIGVIDKLKVHNNYIESKVNESKFLFKGVHRNVQSIKSIPGLTDLWLEEAQTTSAASWEVLIPTMRENGSEIWVTYNPESEDDPTHLKFCGPKGPPEDALVIEANWRDNPWFPEVLEKEKEHMKRTNPDLYEHIWEGQVRTNSDAQIFKGKFEVSDFEINPSWDGPYFGVDWGFSVDPLAIVKCYVDVARNHLIISHETGDVGVDIDKTRAYLDRIPEIKQYPILADNSRPETISYVSRQGYNISAAAKWPGSVEDGIEWIKSFDKVLIHSRCQNTFREFRKYSYKIDRLTGLVTTKIVDAENHYIDAIRYAYEPLISAGRMGILSVL